MDDFRRPPVDRLNTPPIAPKRPLNPTAVTEPVMAPQPALPPQPIEVPAVPPKKSWKKRLTFFLIGFFIAVIASTLAVWVWYSSQLAPVNASDTKKIVVVIEPGNGPKAIADKLKNEGVIRNTTAFLWYTRIEKVQNALQAGTYRLSPSESTQDVVTHLTNGNVDTFDLTFLPGATLKQNREVFLKAGYSEAEVDAALSATYTSPLFEGKPSTADLEGYIYGDTYKFGAGESVQNILTHIFKTYYVAVQKNNLIAQYQARGLTLYQGITLASIIQREAIGGDEPQIAQVFYKRLEIDMPLGSDVTYQYIADKTGVPRDTNLDSPYNTRRYPGLPPGPIAVPGIDALKAVANPAPGNYLYFLSGDDNVTYYGTTLQEHEANIRNHCSQKCQIL